MIKKIEITKLIDEKMNKEPLYFRDLMGNNYTINSYEEFIQKFTLIKNTFKNHIIDFYNEANDLLNKMATFINDCNSETIEEANHFIINNFNSRFQMNYYNVKDLKTIFVDNLPNETAFLSQSFFMIYDELGYDNLISYITLLKQPSLLNSYLSDSTKQLVAMHYILFKTNHHSDSKFKRNNTSSNLYNYMEKNIDESIKEIVKNKDDYINFMNDQKDDYIKFKDNQKSEYDNWFNDANNKYNSFMTDCENDLNNLKQSYSEKLKIEEPSKFMLEKANEYKKKSRHWTYGVLLMTMVLMILFGLILSPGIDIGKKVIKFTLFNKEMSIYNSIIILSIICLIIYVIRIFIKIVISNKHLSEEYYQKYVLTYFYLSLVNSGNIDNNLSGIILSTLFLKADTGLIKNDSNTDFESMIKYLTSSNQ